MAADKFIIVSELNGLVLSVEHDSSADGARLITNPYTGEGSQQFRFKPNGEIIVVGSAKGLSVEGEAKKGNKIVQWPSREVPHQLFRLHKDGSIRVVGSDLCFDVYHDNMNPGAKIVAWPYHGGPNQSWKLVNSFN